MLLLFLITLLGFVLVHTTQACAPPNPRDSNSTTHTDTPSTFPSTITGPDTPADIQTLGYSMYHASLNVNNLTRSLDFYTNVFGMRHTFTHYLTPHLSFTQLVHSQGGRSGSGYQTNSELLRHKNNAAGTLELVHLSLPNKTNIDGSTERTSTLSHLGFVVPCPEATQQRLKEYGSRILKGVGEEWPNEGPLGDPFFMGDASGLGAEAFEAIKKGMAKLNMLNAFAEDPDGNMLEILPIDEGNVFS